MCLKVLLVDDHVMITDCYKMVLKDLEINSEITSVNSLKCAYNFVFKQNLEVIDLAVLDLSMPECLENNLKNGEDLAKLLRTKHPEIKIIFISGYLNKLTLSSIIKNINPEGLVEKSDLDYDSIHVIFKKIVEGEVYKSERINKTINENRINNIHFNILNREIILLISQGITTKNLPNYIPLTLSAIHKRKSAIKELLHINTGNDEDIIRESRKIGII
ncbi:response regulator [Flavobacterium sp. W20_MBD1_R3]|uniref:response regulator n=1 Tax=Flavobacterium sp. W20_MBD1_R3 TaxID=3240278 RepID=UPI003F9266AB